MPTTIAVPKTKKTPAIHEDFLPLEGTDHIEFYVGNAKQAAHFYQSRSVFSRWPIADPKPACESAPATWSGRTRSRLS